MPITMLNYFILLRTKKDFPHLKIVLPDNKKHNIKFTKMEGDKIIRYYFFGAEKIKLTYLLILILFL